MTQHEKIYEFAKDGRDQFGHYIKGHHLGMTGKKHKAATKKN